LSGKVLVNKENVHVMMTELMVEKRKKPLPEGGAW
jgi:hypothetical protein